MIAQLTNHLWQSTVFAVAAGLLTAALRKNRAHVRFWLWFSASLKFLVPFSLLMSLGSQLQWTAARKMTMQIAAPAISFAMEQITEPFAAVLPQAPSWRGTVDWALMAIIGVWACGFAAIVLTRFRAWLRIHAACTHARPVGQTIVFCGLSSCSIRAIPGLLEPGVIGIFRPVLLLPEGIEDRLAPPQLEAVLAHEHCHIRRRDNLFASVHMIVEAVFWFHPLVWWIGARLLEERERACDEEVLRLGSEPTVYAEGILNVCKLYVESPLACVSGVTGSDLKKRIEAIMTNRIVLKLNFAKKVALAVAAITAVAVPIVVGLMDAPTIRAQSAATPKFEVASIKPCKDNSDGARKGGRGGSGPSPGRLALPCRSTMDLIRTAYVQFANGKRNLGGHHIQIEGGPSWINSERFQIDATAEGAPGQEMIRGPMLQALLEDRFKLKIRRETREVPVYALTVAKGGPRNLQAAKEGGCLVLDFNHPPPPPEPGKPFRPCGMFGRKPDGVEIYGTTISNLSEQFSALLDRDVVDKTGIEGVFDFRLDLSGEDLSPAPSDPAVSGNPDDESGLIFAAIRKLGLKIEPAKGPGQFLVIDHVEKPTGN